jgi:hypothetical protein
MLVTLPDHLMLNPNDEVTWFVTSHSSNPDTTVESNERWSFLYDIDAVGETDFSGMPTVFSIAATYPNPFNPTLRVVVGLPDAAPLKLRVYNVLGREVAKLADSAHPAGYHSFRLNAAHLAGGVYFIHAEAAGKKDLGKVLLMK